MMWRWVAPAPIEAAHVLWVWHSPGEFNVNVAVVPNLFASYLIMAMSHAPEPTLLELASVFPGYATAVWHAQQGDFDKLREAAGDLVKA